MSKSAKFFAQMTGTQITVEDDQDTDEVECEQCGDTFRPEDNEGFPQLGSDFCSKTCYDRHWRL